MISYSIKNEATDYTYTLLLNDGTSWLYVVKLGAAVCNLQKLHNF